MNILVLGGTRFFGKLLVEQLIGEGHRVTVATRGITADPFGDKVRRVKVNRSSLQEMSVFQSETFDVVYDQICFTPVEASIACRVFKGNVDRYIFTSTIEVYEPHENTQYEEYCNPYTQHVIFEHGKSYLYAAGKRMAEAAFYQSAAFPVTAVRLPPVMGVGSRTTLFHVNRIREGKPIGLPNREVKRSLISAEEAANFLFWAKSVQINGPINAAGNAAISLQEIIDIIAQTSRRAPMIVNSDNKDVLSPWHKPRNVVMDTSKAVELGFSFGDAREQLASVVRKLLPQSEAF